jgi:hypothetical protein
MIATVTREGFAAARRNPRLAATLWLLNLALALAAGVPGWLALSSVIGPLPEADGLRERFSMGLLVDLVEMRPGLIGGLALAAAGVAFLGLLVGAAATGGALEVLTSRDDRPFAHRFGRGAGRFFVRFLRAGLATLVVAALGAALTAGPLFALSGRLRRESGSELAANGAFFAGLLVGGLAVLLCLLALDAARVRVVREDARRVLPLLRSGFGVVLGHPVKWLGTWGANAAVLLLALVVYLAFRNAVPASTAALVAALFLVQQAFVLVRAWLRVALLASERELVERLRPLPPAAPPPQPAVEPEPVVGPGPAPEPAA